MYRTIQSPLVTQLAIIIIRMIIIRPTLLLVVVVIIYSQLIIKWSILSKQINFVKDWTVIVSVTGVLILVDFSGVKKMTCSDMSKRVQTCPDLSFTGWQIVFKTELWRNLVTKLWHFLCHPVGYTKTQITIYHLSIKEELSIFLCAKSMQVWVSK